MPSRIIISDASTIIALSNIDELILLKSLYQELLVTDIVSDEIQIELPYWINVSSSYNQELYRSLCTRLDKGEASAIALSMKEKGSLLIIDEKKGRKLALELGIHITGLLGIIVKAKEKQLIVSGKQLLEKLNDNGFRLSTQLKNELLKVMNEL